jgi:cytochrome c553
MSALRIGMVLLVAFSWIGHAQAQTEASAEVEADHAWDEAVVEAREVSSLTPRLDRGEEIYQVCSSCHLPSGAGLPDGTMPQLAGQRRTVLIKQMTDIRSGLRHNPSMYPYVARLDGPQALSDVAGYIKTLPIPDDNGMGPGTDLERGEQIYGSRCSRCHGFGGEGVEEAFYPKIAGQHYRYLVRQMIDIAGGRRGNANPDMTQVVGSLSAKEIASVADYVSRMVSRMASPTESGNDHTESESGWLVECVELSLCS